MVISCSVLVLLLLFLVSGGAAQEALVPVAPKIQMPETSAMLPEGMREIEYGVLNSHFSRNRVVLGGYTIFETILIGTVDAEKIQRDIIIPSVRWRLGIGKNSEVGVTLPLRYRSDHITYLAERYEGPREIQGSNFGFGDAEFAVSHQLRNETAARPGVIANVEMKLATGVAPWDVSSGGIPLGTGHYGLRAGLAAVRTISPVMLLADVQYFWNLAAAVPDVGLVNPGDSWGYDLAVTYKISPRFSISGRFEQRVSAWTLVNGNRVLGSESNAATLYLGSTTAFEKGSYFDKLDVTAGVGLTEDAPDFVLKLSATKRY